MFEVMLGTFLKKPLDFLRNGKWGSVDTSFGNNYHSSGAVVEDNFFLVGGRVSTGSVNTKNITRFNMVTEQRVVVATLPKALNAHGTAVIGDDLYIAGGEEAGTSTANRILYRFNTLTNVMSVEDNLMPFIFLYGGMTAIENKLYFFSGTNRQGDVGSPSIKIFWVWDTVTKTWEEITLPPDIPPTLASEILAIDGKLWMFGGKHGTTYYNQLRRYDPELNIWTPITPIGQIPSERVIRGCSTSYKDRYIVVYGGEYIVNNAVKDSWVYDTIDDVWSTLADFPTNVAYGATGVHGDKIVQVGGFSGGAGINGVWWFRP